VLTPTREWVCVRRPGAYFYSGRRNADEAGNRCMAIVRATTARIPSVYTSLARALKYALVFLIHSLKSKALEEPFKDSLNKVLDICNIEFNNRRHSSTSTRGIENYTALPFIFTYARRASQAFKSNNQ